MHWQPARQATFSPNAIAFRSRVACGSSTLPRNCWRKLEKWQGYWTINDENAFTILIATTHMTRWFGLAGLRFPRSLHCRVRSSEAHQRSAAFGDSRNKRKTSRDFSHDKRGGWSNHFSPPHAMVHHRICPSYLYDRPPDCAGSMTSEIGTMRSRKPCFDI